VYSCASAGAVSGFEGILLLVRVHACYVMCSFVLLCISRRCICLNARVWRLSTSTNKHNAPFWQHLGAELEAVRPSS
jgi:hypothetical protein